MAVAAGPLLATQLALAVLGDPARHLGVFLVLETLAFSALGWAGWWLARSPRAGEGAGALLLVAALLRLLLLPLPATLSADLGRYVWDGRVLLAGENPYREAPDSPRLAELRNDAWSRLHHKSVPTVYPPLALGVFALASAAGDQAALWLKATFGLADCLACWLLLHLARGLGSPPQRWIWYAWNPLVCLEGAGMGHLDTLAVALLLAGAWAFWLRRGALAGTWVGLGIVAKLAPLFVLPAWGRARGGGPKLVLAALALAFALWLPFLVDLGGIPPGLLIYGISWEFDGPLYEPLWRGLAWLRLDHWLAVQLDHAKAWLGHDSWWNHFYPYLYPQLLAKMVLGLGALAVILNSLRPRGPWPSRNRRLFGGLLLCSATVYPWYLLWVLPWAALTAHRGWLLLSASILLSYLAQLRGISLWPWLYLLVWAPAAAVSWLDRRPEPGASA
ncbi:MAG: hypothetical protein U0002_03770 [Thermoanaerobaculia bacterium]